MRDDLAPGQATAPEPDTVRQLPRPDFLLPPPPSRSLATTGTAYSYDCPADAARALERGDAALVVGALPFDTSAPAALTVPKRFLSVAGPLETPELRHRARLPTTTSEITDRAEHHRRVSSAIGDIPARSGLQKIVVARELTISAAESMDPHTLAARFIDSSPRGDGFLVDLSPAGPEFHGRRLVGSSPELLVSRRQGRVRAFPLAGSAPRTGDPVRDAAAAATLMDSAKDLAEHAFVVDEIRRCLEPLCGPVDHPERPQVVSTRAMLHLGTPMTAPLRDNSTTALTLALAVHPTPAICGVPTADAAEWIPHQEGDRRFYSGAVGWCDATGDGIWVIAIRCLELSPDSTSATAWAGGGIVRASDPSAEWRETEAKFRAALEATGSA